MSRDIPGVTYLVRTDTAGPTVGERSGNSPNIEDSDRDEKWWDTDNLDDYDR
jgi:hypothetical protein